MTFLVNAAIVLATIVAMELIAIFAHKYIMHGWGWGWHASHHAPRTGWFEKNDLYAVVFAVLAIVLIALGTAGRHPLEWIGAGMTAYGLLYFLAHDGLVHRRLPLGYVPREGYLKRLYQAHLLHHAVHGKEGCVSFGFLYAPRVTDLKRELQRRQAATRDPIERGLAKRGPAKRGPAKRGPAERSPAEPGAADCGPPERGPTRPHSDRSIHAPNVDPSLIDRPTSNSSN